MDQSEGVRIFISYPSKSHDYVALLKDYLSRRGTFRFWHDDQEVRVGDEVSRRLSEGLEQSDVCLFILNTHSVKSTWCMAEVGAFWGAGKTILVHTIDPKCSPPPFLAGLRAASTLEEVLDACLLATRRGTGISRLDVEAMRQSSMTHAFRIPTDDHRREKRVAQLVRDERSEAAPAFSLLASSGFSYLTPQGKVWRAGLGEALAKQEATLNVVLESPFSRFAVARALANKVRHHHWEEKMPTGVLDRLAEHPKISIAVTEDPVNCSLFFTSHAVFYDPYLCFFPDAGGPTENNFWVFEFQRSTEPDYDCFDLLRKHLDFLASTSVPLKEFLGEDNAHYLQRTEEFREMVRP